MIKSRKQFIEQSKGKTILKEVSGVPTVEDWPEMKATILKQLKEQGCPDSDIEERNGCLYFGNQYISIPKFKRSEKGTLVFRSKDYYFTPGSNESESCFGDLKGLKIENGCAVKSYSNGLRIVFSIIE